jgi:hypothetical protein
VHYRHDERNRASLEMGKAFGMYAAGVDLPFIREETYQGV